MIDVLIKHWAEHLVYLLDCYTQWQVKVASYQIVLLYNCVIPFTNLRFTTQMFVQFVLSNYSDSRCRARCIIGVKWKPCSLALIWISHILNYSFFSKIHSHKLLDFQTEMDKMSLSNSFVLTVGAEAKNSTENRGGLYRGDVSKTLGTCLILCNRSSWAIWYLSFKNQSKNETVRAKQQTLGWGYEKKRFCSNLIYFKGFQDQVYVLGYRFGAKEPIPTLKFTHQNFVAWKTTLLINFRGVHKFFLSTAV